MNKYIFSSLFGKVGVGLLLLLCSMTTAWAETTNEVIEVSTADGLKKAIQDNNSANIKLTADIDISNVGTICDTFRGHIYGKYQYTNEAGELRDTVYSLKAWGKEIPNLFNRLDCANIEHVMLDYFSVKGKGDNVGGLAKSASYTNFSYVVIYQVTVSSEDDNVGGLLGNADHCKFESVSINNSSIRSEETIVGGLVGESHQCTFLNCVNFLSSVFGYGALASNYARVGGFCGYSVGDMFTDCVNAGVVGGNEDSVGGFAGRSDDTNFLRCRNSGVVVHATKSEFEQVVESVKQLYADKVYDPTYFHSIMENAIFGGTLTFMFPFFAGYICLSGTALAGSALMIVASVGLFFASFLVMAGISAYVAWLTTLHDEIGGICGQANRGEFSLCTNSGYINCRDSQGGGIVGRASAITVDNCLNDNKCEWGDDDCGGIIGEATEGCKVTNCLNTFESPIIGAAKNMNTASGNNYCLASDNTWQEKVDDEKLESGRVAYWLNNGIENRDKGISPWHQTLGKDKHPLLDASHNAITRDSIFDVTISNVEELHSFAKMVKFRRVYTNAKLCADIDMTNEEWVPVGDTEDDTRYCGIFDGQGHTIKGLKFNEGYYPAGLFGCLGEHAEIRNLIIGDDSEFSNPHEGAGGIAGRVHLGSHSGMVIIENCGSYANVKATKHAGGILGRVSTGDDSGRVRVYINNCFSSGVITADDGNSGLISGDMKNHGYVSNCWSNAQLRIGDGYTTWPYGCERGINECFVGYDKDLNINNCFITDPDKKVDRYTEKDLQSGITTVTSAEVANGMLTYKLNGGNKTSESHIWQQNLLANSAPVHGSKGVYYTHDIFESGFGTICLPYTVRSNDKVKYYRLVEVAQSEDKVELIFDYAASIGSGVPCLYVSSVDEASHEFLDDVGFIYSDKTYEYSVSGWYLKGTFTDLSFKDEAAKSIYTISTKGNVNNYPRSKHVPSYRAYIDGPNIDTLNGKTIHLVVKGVNDVATTIGTLPLREGQGGSPYTLMGTKAPAGYKGIVIMNGRKYVRK